MAPLLSTFGAASARSFGGIGAAAGASITSVVFVANQEIDTIHAIDVSDPNNPVEIDTLSGSTYNGVSGIAADQTNKRIYFCTRNTTRRVGVIDVSNPKSMSLGSTLNVGSGDPLFACDIDVTNSRLWVAGEGQVYAINVSNQASFSLLGNRSIGGTNAGQFDISVDPDTGFAYSNSNGSPGKLQLLEWDGSSVQDRDDQDISSGYGGLGIAPSGTGDNVFIAISSTSQEQILLKEGFTSGAYTDQISNASTFTKSGSLDGAKVNIFHRSRDYLYNMSQANSHKLVTIDVSNINNPTYVRQTTGGTTYLNQPQYGVLDDTNDKMYVTNYDSNGAYLTVMNVASNAQFRAKLTLSGSGTDPGQVKVINYDPPV
jgi:hypothetical protein